MTKSLYIAEKPSVAQEFAKALKQNMQRRDGYLESETSIVTWCVGHLVTMSYPEKYDPALKRWSLETLPFLPENFKYEVIPEVKKQFNIVSGLLHREDIETIYVCTDSGREGEYIYRLVAQMAGIKDKKQKRVWIDSQTEEEILRGIREAKDESEYDNLSASAYLRAKEDYLMGINFSRLLSLKYGNAVASYLGTKYQSIRPLLNPELTASWEKGLTYVAEGSITSEEYMGKLENFVTRHTVNVKQMRNQFQLKSSFDASAPYYKKASSTRSGAGKNTSSRSSSAKSSSNRKKTAQNT